MLADLLVVFLCSVCCVGVCVDFVGLWFCFSEFVCYLVFASGLRALRLVCCGLLDWFDGVVGLGWFAGLLRLVWVCCM